jgi:DNA-binding response OmpR family regulator
MRVLLIGRHKLLVKALKQGLEEEGFSVDIPSAVQAENYPTAAYDVIVLDLVHPQETCLSVLQCWRWAGLNTPVLVLAPPAIDDDIAPLTDAGADDWLIKPFGLEELLARLRNVATFPRSGRTPDRVRRTAWAPG